VHMVLYASKQLRVITTVSVNGYCSDTSVSTLYSRELCIQSPTRHRDSIEQGLWQTKQLCVLTLQTCIKSHIQ
jgi:hypothetical protein